MQQIVREVKAVIKKYETKSGKKESVSKRIDIGVDETFEIGESVVIISKTALDEFTTESAEIIAEKDATIDALNESIANFKREIKTKTDKIGDLSKEIKALKSTIEKLESDVSAKDDIIAEIESGESDAATTIAELEKTVADKDAAISDSEKIIDGLNDKLDELNATISELKPLLLAKDETIAELEKEIAVYDAIDISELKDKAKELDKSKNIIIRLQNETKEYLQLVNFKDKENTALRNQKWYHKALGKNATADILPPTLYLIDVSGNPIKSKDNDETTDDSGESKKPDEVTLI